MLRLHVLGPAVLLVAGVTAASAQDRCEGTLCDLYYEHLAKPAPATSAQPQAQQSARTAAQPAPSQPAQAGDSVLSRLFGGAPPPAQPEAPPVKKPLVAVQGDGVVGLLQGRAPQRCTGTLCDFYYGGPPPAEPAAAERATPEAATARAAEAATDEPSASASSFRGVEPRESVRSCAANARDPWACYR